MVGCLIHDEPHKIAVESLLRQVLDTLLLQIVWIDQFFGGATGHIEHRACYNATDLSIRNISPIGSPESKFVLPKHGGVRKNLDYAYQEERKFLIHQL